MKPRVCLHCGVTYKPSGWKSRYCSMSCSGKRLRKSPEVRLQWMLERINKTEACWLWTGRIGFHGYGLATHLGRPMSAHRLYWQLVNGAIPAGMVLDHTCRIRHCVNPDHLRICTPRENSDLAWQRGAPPVRYPTKRKKVGRRRRTSRISSCIQCGTAFDSLRPNHVFCSKVCRYGAQRVSLAERGRLFWERVDKTETCWLWTGRLSKAGYGQASHGRGKRAGEAVSMLVRLVNFYLSHPEELILHFAALLAALWILGAVLFAAWANRIKAREQVEREKFERILQAGTTQPPRAPGFNSRRVG